MIINKRIALEIEQIVYNNYHNIHFNAATLSQILNIKKSMLYRICIYNLHCNPQDFIENMRLEIAAEKLKRDYDIQIKDVAKEVGYTDIKQFSKIFKQKFGMGPFGYKKQLLQSA